MSMSMGSSEGVKSDINVTPLVDVMLVLLIIMMIVAPMLQKGVDVRLPSAANTSDKPETQEQTVLAVKSDRTVYINAVQVPMNDLRRKMEEALEAQTQKVVLIKADEDAPYGTVMEAMDEIRAGGIEDMGLITEKKAKAGGGQ
jgi:biopolymer transport protein TolR